uniref:DDE_3 domain-containing protein n=1 Tax=Heterorhabditis bacteriophora TaxID=37862 RepID=A0A1I7X7B8_HETBA
MVWLAFSAMGLVDLAFVSTKMNSVECQNVLEYRLVPYVQRFPGIMPQSTLGCKTMIWPSRSPDRNPMENLWAILVHRIYGDNYQFETDKDLQSAISKAWNEVDESVIKNLVNSTTELIFQVINRNGSCTDY